MVRLDVEKYKTQKTEIILRPDFGTSPPIKGIFISRMAVDEDDMITSFSYVHPKTYRDHWAYGHQVDEVLYFER